MPDVGMFTATDPLGRSMKVVIKLSVEVEELPVYQESYSVDTLAKELKADREETLRRWGRRLECVVGCRNKAGFSACVTRCFADGQCCEMGGGSKESQE